MEQDERNLLPQVEAKREWCTLWFCLFLCSLSLKFLFDARISCPHDRPAVCCSVLSLSPVKDRPQQQGEGRCGMHASRLHELNAWMNARRHRPFFARLGHPHRSRITFAVDGSLSHKLKKQEADGDQRQTHPTDGG